MRLLVEIDGWAGQFVCGRNLALIAPAAACASVDVPIGLARLHLDGLAFPSPGFENPPSRGKARKSADLVRPPIVAVDGGF